MIIAVILFASATQPPMVDAPAPTPPTAEQQAEAARDQKILDGLREKRRIKNARTEAIHDAYLAQEQADWERADLLKPYKDYNAVADAARQFQRRVRSQVRDYTGLQLPSLNVPALRLPGEPDAQINDPREQLRQMKSAAWHMHFALSMDIKQRTGYWVSIPSWLDDKPPLALPPASK